MGRLSQDDRLGPYRIVGPLDRDWAAAEREYQRAIALRPDYATAHQWYGELLTSRGRKEEARAAMERARELDPLSAIIAASDIWLELMFRDYDAAVRSGRSTIAAFPDFPSARSYTARALLEKGQNSEAIAMHRTAVSLRPSKILELWLAEALARDGKTSEALAIVRRIEAGGEYVNPYYLAFPYIALGDQERALDLLEEALETSVEQLAWFDLDPSLDPLRTSPRFQSMSKRLEVPRIQD
ncbi:MAG TPA: tetratricopeptide repeat protein [Thermoanaerobaculia bacterium]|nr:tetratricopeptide repeat protein [Thermoanaerobaculia bacterium]